MKITNQKSSAELVGMILGALLLLGFTPVITIWALNTLFGLSIPVTLATWGSVVWIKMIFVGLISNVGKNS